MIGFAQLIVDLMFDSWNTNDYWDCLYDPDVAERGGYPGYIGVDNDEDGSRWVAYVHDQVDKEFVRNSYDKREV